MPRQKILRFRTRIQASSNFRASSMPPWQRTCHVNLPRHPQVQVTFYARRVATAVACSRLRSSFTFQASQADRVVDPPRHGKRFHRVASSDAASSSVQTESNLVDDSPLLQSAPFVRSRVTRHSRSRASRPRRSQTSYSSSSSRSAASAASHRVVPEPPRRGTVGTFVGSSFASIGHVRRVHGAMAQALHS